MEPRPGQLTDHATRINYTLQSNGGLLPAELAAIDDICNQVEVRTRDDTNPDSQAWRRAAIATKVILRDRSEEVKSEWLAAYAALPPMRTLPDLN